jgi:hypothetical protein
VISNCTFLKLFYSCLQEITKDSATRAIKEKDEKIERLKHRLSEAEKVSMKERKELQENYEKHIRGLEGSIDENVLKIHQLQSELDMLQDFRVLPMLFSCLSHFSKQSARAKLLADFEAMKKEADETKKAADEKVIQIERKFWEEKLRFKNELEQQLGKIKKAAEDVFILLFIIAFILIFCFDFHAY